MRTWLFVVPWDPRRPGGVDQVVLNLYRQVAAHGQFAPRIFIGSWVHKTPLESIDDCRATVRMRLRQPLSVGSGFLGFLSSLWCLPREMARLHGYLVRQRVEVINVHYPGLTALQFIILKRLLRRDLQVILSFHGQDLAAALDARGVTQWLWRRLLRSADAVVGNSEDLTRRLSGFASETRANPVTIHNGIDIEAFIAERDPIEALDAGLTARPFILCVAAFEPKKGLDVLLLAFSILKRGSNPDLRLVLVGTDNGLLAGFERWVQREGLAGDVLFFEAVPHSKLHPLYEAATVFCLPSREEPFGLVLLEAGAFALPVLASRVGGIPEIIVHGDCGRLVAPDDPQALARELGDLLAHPDERARLGRALHARVREEFTWTRAYKRYAELVHRA